jgi:rubrerythrin
MQDKFSNNISEFLNFIHSLQSRYNLAKEELDKQENITQDLLHSLELDTLTYKQRCKVATQLSHNRKNRRLAKDELELITPLYTYINDPANKKVFDKLTDILGETRKVEKRHQNRTYYPRVLKSENKDVH